MEDTTEVQFMLQYQSLESFHLSFQQISFLMFAQQYFLSHPVLSQNFSACSLSSIEKYI